MTSAIGAIAISLVVIAVITWVVKRRSHARSTKRQTFGDCGPSPVRRPALVGTFAASRQTAATFATAPQDLGGCHCGVGGCPRHRALWRLGGGSGGSTVSAARCARASAPRDQLAPQSGR